MNDWDPNSPMPQLPRMQPSWEPLSSLQAGPDTYPWANEEAWTCFCRAGARHVAPAGLRAAFAVTGRSAVATAMGGGLQGTRVSG